MKAPNSLIYYVHHGNPFRSIKKPVLFYVTNLDAFVVVIGIDFSKHMVGFIGLVSIAI